MLSLSIFNVLEIKTKKKFKCSFLNFKAPTQWTHFCEICQFPKKKEMIQKDIVRRLVLLYMFANFFNIWLNRRWLVLHSMLWYAVLVEVDEKKSGLTQLCLRNREVAISACGYLLILEQNSSGNFLEINCNVEFVTLSVNFLHSDTLKSFSLPCSLNRSLTHARFCNITHWNTGSLSYPNIPNTDISLYIPKKRGGRITLTSLMSSEKTLNESDVVFTE